MKNPSLKVLSAVLLLTFLSNCSQRITDFTIISSKNVDLSKVSTFKRSSARVEGQDKKHIIFFIPTGIPNLKAAMDRAIEKTPGAVALLDGTVTLHHWYLPPLYGQQWIEVEGTALIDPELKKNIVE